MLGLVVEAATGNSLSIELQRRILGPLRLRRTTFHATASHITASHAHAYTAGRPGGPRQEVDALSSSLAWAAGALVSTAGDVGRFYRALLQGRVVRADLLRLMRRRRSRSGCPASPTASASSKRGRWRLAVLPAAVRELRLGPRRRPRGVAELCVQQPQRPARGGRALNTDVLKRRAERALGRMYATAFCG